MKEASLEWLAIELVECLGGCVVILILDEDKTLAGSSWVEWEMDLSTLVTARPKVILPIMELLVAFQKTRSIY